MPPPLGARQGSLVSPRPRGVLAPLTACGRCGRSFDVRAWHTLELVELVAPARVREHVTHWPEGTAVEARRCPCGSFIARSSAEPG